MGFVLNSNKIFLKNFKIIDISNKIIINRNDLLLRYYLDTNLNYLHL